MVTVPFTDRQPAPRPAPAPAPVPEPLPIPFPVPTPAAPAPAPPPTPAPSTDPYAEAARTVTEATAQGVRSQLFAATARDPDQHAKALRLADSIGVPVGVVETARDQLQQAQRLNAVDVQSLVRANPRLVAWLADHDNAVIGQDDLVHLARIDTAAEAIARALSVPQDDRPDLPWWSGVAGRYARRGVFGSFTNVLSAPFAAVEMAGRAALDAPLTEDDIADPGWSPAATIVFRVQQMRDEERAAATYRESTTQRATGALWEMLANPANIALPLAGAGLGARGVAATLAPRAALTGASLVMAEQSAGMALLDSMSTRQQQGAGGPILPEAADLGNAAVQGAIGYLGGYLGGLRGILRGFNPATMTGRDLLKDIAIQAAVGAGQGSASAAAAGVILPDRPMPTGAQLVEEALVGGFAGGAMAAGGGAVHLRAQEMARRIVDAQAATAAAGILAKAGVALNGSKAFTRNGERVLGLLRQAIGAGDGVVYFQGDDLDQVAGAAGIPPEVLRQRLGLTREDMAEAAASRAPLAVDAVSVLAEAAKAGPKAVEAMLDRFRVHPDAPNLAQAAAFTEALPAEVAALRRDVETAVAPAEPTPVDRIYADVHRQLLETGHDEAFADAHSRLWAAHHGAVAYWWNRDAEARGAVRYDPWAEYAAKPLRIQRGERADLATELAQGDNGGRTVRGTFDPVGNVVRLFEAENLSSFSHETGHGILEHLTDLAGREGSPDILRQDLATVRDFLGVAGDAMGWTRAQHETWARHWEAYLMEGAAPSPALAGPFARFRTWLTTVYRSVLGLERAAGRPVKLSDPVRRVMDRLLATEEEISAAQAMQGQMALLANDAVAGALGMNMQEREAYTAAVGRARQAAVDRVMAEQIAAEQAGRRAEASTAYRRIAAEVAAQIDAQPIYKALSSLRDRTASPGLDRASLGLEPLELAALARKGVLAKANDGNGVLADVVAPLWGFDSGHALARALLAARDRDSAIRAAAKVRLRAEHPDLLPTAGGVADRAMRAVHGSERVEVLRIELDRLSRRVNGKPAPSEVLRRLALDRVARMQVLTLRPDRFRSAEAKAAREAFAAATRGDFEAAFQAKQRELLNHELYQAARAAQEQADGMQRHMVELTKPAAQERIGKAGGWEWTVVAADGALVARVGSENEARAVAARTPGATWERTSSFQEQINGILERFNLKPMSARQIQRQRSLQAWQAMMVDEGFPVDLPAEVMGDRRANWRELTVDELRGVHDAVVQIEHLARLKNKLLASKDRANFQAVRTELVASIAAHATGVRQVRAGTTLATDLRVKLDGIVGSLERFGDTVQRLDGFQDGGAAWSILKRPFDEAANRKAAMTEGATAELGKLLTAWEAAGGRGRVRDPFAKLHIPAIGQSLSHLERIMVALNCGNDGNLVRLKEGFGWSDAQVQAVLATLDSADAALVRGIAGLVNSYWSEIVAKSQRVTGLRPEKVEGRPFAIAGEQVEGFYFPVIYDRRQSASAALRDMAQVADMVRRGAFTAATTKRGHLQARQEGSGAPLDLDFLGVSRHLDQVFHDLTHHEALIDANRILRDPETRTALEAYHGPAVIAETVDALQRIAGSAVRDIDGLEAGMRRMNKNLPLAAMAYNVWSAIQNVTGVTQSMERVGPLNFLRALAPLVGDAGRQQSLRAFVFESSDYMRRRFKQSGTSMREQTARGVDAIGRDTPDALRPFSMMEAIQLLVDLPTWKAAYDSAIAQKDHAAAVLMADQAVVDAQAGKDIKDKAAAFDGSEYKKALTMFGSWFNATFNMSRRAYLRTDFRDPVSVALLGRSFLLLYAIPTALTLAGMAALRPNRRRDEKPLPGRLLAETLGMMAATIPGVRELGAGIKGEPYGGPAGMRGFDTLNRFISQARQMELDGSAGKAVLDALGLATGLPSTQLQRTLDGILYDIDHRRPDPRAILFGAPR